MKQDRQAKYRNPRPFWLQVWDAEGNLIKQVRLFCSEWAMRERAKFEAQQPEADTVWVISGSGKPMNEREEPSLTNPIIGGEIIQELQTQQFEGAIPVAGSKRLKFTDVNGNFVRYSEGAEAKPVYATLGRYQKGER